MGLRFWRKKNKETGPVVELEEGWEDLRVNVLLTELRTAIHRKDDVGDKLKATRQKVREILKKLNNRYVKVATRRTFMDAPPRWEEKEGFIRSSLNDQRYGPHISGVYVVIGREEFMINPDSRILVANRVAPEPGDFKELAEVVDIFEEWSRFGEEFHLRSRAAVEKEREIKEEIIKLEGVWLKFTDVIHTGYTEYRRAGGWSATEYHCRYHFNGATATVAKISGFKGKSYDPLEHFKLILSNTEGSCDQYTIDTSTRVIPVRSIRWPEEDSLEAFDPGAYPEAKEEVRQAARHVL